VAQTSFCDVCELCFPSRCSLSTVNQPSGPSQTCKLPHVCATRREALPYLLCIVNKEPQSLWKARLCATYCKP
jgi:hypothetical protein